MSDTYYPNAVRNFGFYWAQTLLDALKVGPFVFRDWRDRWNKVPDWKVWDWAAYIVFWFLVYYSIIGLAELVFAHSASTLVNAIVLYCSLSLGVSAYSQYDYYRQWGYGHTEH